MKTQGDIAKQAGISDAFLSLILSGQARPSWATAKRLAEITETDPALWMDAEPKALQDVVIAARLKN